MLRYAAAAFGIVVTLSWIGRLDNDMAVTNSVKERLLFGAQTLHNMIVDRNMGVLDAEPIAEFPTDHPLALRGKSVGLLELKFPKHWVSCTATVIGPNLILTNRHCIVDGSTRPTKGNLSVDFLDRSDFGELFEVDPVPVEEDKALDYAILTVKPSKDGAQVTPLPTLRFRAPQPSEDLIVLHHPSFLPLVATRAHCRAAGKGKSANAGVLHTCRTAGGSSGSLLFASDGSIVGLHNGRPTINGKTVGRATAMLPLLAASPILRGLEAK